MNSFEKLKIALEWQLIGRKYFNALKAFNIAIKHHTGLRKDGITHEFKHQLDICSYILTLNIPDDKMESFIIAGLLHDIREDYNIEHKFIVDLFGLDIGNAVELLTKKFKGIKKSAEDYFFKLEDNEIASIVKGADRINNLNTMVGVFTKEKQLDYIAEVEKHFLPMLKNARKNFPENTFAYLNIETILKQQISFVKAIHI